MEYITSARAAELNAAARMRALGYVDATATPIGPDGGIDVVATSAVAQVKWEASQTGRPHLQRFYGAAAVRADVADMLFINSAGYSRDAVAYADRVTIALFTYSPLGELTAVNSTAEAIIVRHAEAERKAQATYRANERLAHAKGQGARDTDQLQTVAIAKADRSAPTSVLRTTNYVDRPKDQRTPEERTEARLAWEAKHLRKPKNLSTAPVLLDSNERAAIRAYRKLYYSGTAMKDSAALSCLRNDSGTAESIGAVVTLAVGGAVSTWFWLVGDSGWWLTLRVVAVLIALSTVTVAAMLWSVRSNAKRYKRLVAKYGDRTPDYIRRNTNALDFL
ncbi:restriction endonuclease [Gordonia sp. TBRC 11910]|uniref:Restriction endonuclease n=1 Tax=Gordonia asplenii TaxID=2725283 RepID=A0A848L6K0_9ACTN|nr:restriction endonuclease [Gordonia asplenii]NMO04313.1 restriction endonuclease [Gordonia asplenii]